MKKLSILVFWFLGILANVLPAQAVSYDIIRNQIDSIRKKYDNIGLAVVCVKDAKIVYSDVFGNNPDPNDSHAVVPIKKNNLFYIASVTKTFVGTAVMHLVDDQKLSLEDDVNKYLGFSLRNPNYPDIPITIGMLLSHRSSLKKSAPYDDFDKLDPERNAEYLGFWNSYRPGSAFDYSNLGFAILGAVIENVSGLRFDEYVQKYILKPLRIRGGFDVSSLDASKLVYPSRYLNNHFVVQKKAYASDAKKMSQYILGYSTPLLNPAGGLKISANDLAKYMIMHMKNGKYRRKQVLSEESELKMRERQANTTYGLSFVHFMNVIPGEDLVGMNGANHGIHSSMYFQPDKKYGFVVICNGCNSETYADSGLNDEVIRLLYSSLIQEH